MIILDTHIWERWVEEPVRLRAAQTAAIVAEENDVNGVLEYAPHPSGKSPSSLNWGESK